MFQNKANNKYNDDKCKILLFKGPGENDGEFCNFVHANLVTSCGWYSQVMHSLTRKK